MGNRAASVDQQPFAVVDFKIDMDLSTRTMLDIRFKAA